MTETTNLPPVGNKWRGRINGEYIPRVIMKNGNFVGISIDGANKSAEFVDGQYINQIVFQENPIITDGVRGLGPGNFLRWDGENFVYVSPEEAGKFYQNRNDYINETLSETKYDAYISATRPEGVSAEGVAQSLRYPFDVSTGDWSDYVIFDFFDYQPPFKDNEGFYAELPDNVKASKVAEWWNGNANKRLFVNQTLDQYNRTGTSKDLYQNDPNYPQILLYMPDDISDTFAANWEGKAFGSTTAGLLSASGTDSFAKKIQNTVNTTGKSIKKAPIEIAAALVTNLAKGITGDAVNTGDIFGGISGVIRNPNTEVLFQKMNLRTFDLTFKLVPYKAAESQTIQSIVKTFKKAMLPQYQLGAHKVLGESGQDNAAIEASFIKVPKVCKVAYMRGSSVHPHLPKYKMCAITDVSVNYTPDGNYAVYGDGYPVAVELKVSFMETKLIFSEDVSEGGY